MSKETLNNPSLFTTILKRCYLLTLFVVGSPWGAGTYAERLPTKRELKIAECQGMAFYDVVSRVRWDSRESTSTVTNLKSK